ncbi:MAG: hypothetical protein H7257_02305 [Taibaiella sp.]|nr:hypothetical protein [Taibaiella sp.]
MRKILILLILLAPLAIHAKDKKKSNIKHILPGRWVEAKRLSPDSAVIAFTDTLFMSFYPRDSFNYRLRNGFVYKGKYKFDEDNHLEFGTAAYEVVLRRPPNNMVLANAAGIYYFIADTSDTAAVVILDPTEKILPVTDIESMTGKWSVYKTTVDKDGADVDYSSQVKTVYITGPGTDDRQGYLYCGNDNRSNPSYYIKSLGEGQMLECVGTLTRSIKVLKCQNGELILQENGVTYFFKQFR